MRLGVRVRFVKVRVRVRGLGLGLGVRYEGCLLYTSDAADER